MLPAPHASLVAVFLSALLAACGSNPVAGDSEGSEPAARQPASKGIWARWNAYGDEITYLNTRYLSEGPPIVAETFTIWRPEPEITSRIRTRRAFWCKEEEIALLERWTSMNGAPFKKREISEERRRR